MQWCLQMSLTVIRIHISLTVSTGSTLSTEPGSTVIEGTSKSISTSSVTKPSMSTQVYTEGPTTITTSSTTASDTGGTVVVTQQRQTKHTPYSTDTQTGDIFNFTSTFCSSFYIFSLNDISLTIKSFGQQFFKSNDDIIIWVLPLKKLIIFTLQHWLLNCP